MTVAMLPLVLVAGAGAMGAMMGGDVAGAVVVGVGTLLAGLIALVLTVPVNMALSFAPALVILQDQTATRAIDRSFRGCLKNIVLFLIYGVILLLLEIVAAIPFGLGWCSHRLRLARFMRRIATFSSSAEFALARKTRGCRHEPDD